MSEPQPLGDYIRDRRLALGFSAGQLAMRLKSTAAVVRTWERGHEPVPDDAFSGLADLLDVDEAVLRALQPTADTAPAAEAEPLAAPTPIVALAEETKEQDAADIEAAASAAEPVDVEADADAEDATPEDQPEAAPPEASLAEATEEPVDGAEAAADDPEPHTDDSAGDDDTSPSAAVVGHTPGLDIDTGLLDAPTEAIEPVRPLRTALATRARRRARPAAIAETEAEADEPPSVEPAATEVDGTVPAWLGPLGVIFDPDKRYLYWARWIGTAIGLYILLRVLGFALDGLVEAVGDFWDSFRTPEGPLEDDIVTSLGRLG